MDGIQTRMLYLFSEGVKKRGLSMKRFVELTSENAARFYHRYPQKGCIQPGSDADLVLITEKVYKNGKLNAEKGSGKYLV